ncbi:MAG: hypothetical protein H7062_10605, partial [Candidatus Saccharimonas sp.]|nr:hypothetical protein [Planctomycetaceae bacterium]
MVSPTCRSIWLLFVFGIVVVVCEASCAEDLPISGAIQVTPASLTLKHHRYEQSLIVSGRTAEGLAVDLTDGAVIRSSDESVAIVKQGWITPLKSGEAKIVVQAAGQTVEVPLKIELPAAELPYSF